jgi:hypothetical protein
MQLTSKIRIYPTAEQEGVLWTLSEQCRLIYNFALSDRKMEYETTGKTIPYVEQQNYGRYCIFIAFLRFHHFHRFSTLLFRCLLPSRTMYSLLLILLIYIVCGCYFGFGVFLVDVTQKCALDWG